MLIPQELQLSLIYLNIKLSTKSEIHEEGSLFNDVLMLLN